jgi:hypothetical protein
VTVCPLEASGNAITGLIGDDHWACLRRDRTSTLASLLRRITTTLGPVPLERVVEALTRYTPRRPAMYGSWPPTHGRHPHGLVTNPTGSSPQPTDHRHRQPRGSPARPTCTWSVYALAGGPLSWTLRDVSSWGALRCSIGAGQGVVGDRVVRDG